MNTSTTATNSAAPIALVTGGSRGLGRSTALALATRGTDVVLTYQSQRDHALAVVTEIEQMGRRAVALPLDMALSASFPAFATAVQAALTQHWQRNQFNYLVNNAGMGLHASVAQTTEAQFDAIVNVHFKGVFFLTQALLPSLADGGRIVNVSTGLTRFCVPGYAAYAAAKGAVEVLTRYFAKELGPRGIAVNSVAPGAIATDFGGGRTRDDAQLNKFVASQTALGRAGEPSDIGPMIASLLSADHGWVNAQRIEVSGGMYV